MTEGMRLLQLLYGDDAKGSGIIPCRGYRPRDRTTMPAFRSDTQVWRG